MILFQIYFIRSLNLSFFFCFYLLNGYIFGWLQNFLFLFFRLNICFNSCKLFLIFFCLFRYRFAFSLLIILLQNFTFNLFRCLFFYVTFKIIQISLFLFKINDVAKMYQKAGTKPFYFYFS